jgi:hypothetical protein
MSWYDEDFYYETSEFDHQVNEFKESLLKSVKEEFISEMERLKKENAELQTVKHDFEQIKRDYKNKEQKLEMERQELERKVRRERLSVLMKDFEVVMYRAYSKTELPPKCDKCDDKRRVHFKSPLGRNFTEDCECNKGELVYHPQEYICSSFSINRDGNGMDAWYKLKPNREDDYASYDSSTYAKVIYHDGLKYEDIKKYDTFFKTKEECQGYCDWLNENKRD